ncbi:hypothetical protein DUNSADRAFT_3057 [Dunaliella salina]|uniref:CAAX prenyl protease n=1 Tax=Dunaliella salina TaxID=3046 RepID=A0ABQ7GUT5_DUNSA|nr:hypothetical protein DUNSADRAFT_3057 [Dunaliella salina]|eukprot:KAF5838325.1 hypothetical protein DUNSADRAFT_3057 [Dunaliella salina]
MLLGQRQPNELPLLELFLAFTTAVFFFHSYVDWRQLQALKIRSPPKEVEGTDLADPTEFSKTRQYSIDKWFFNAYQSCYSLLETWAIFLVGALPYAWRLSGVLLHQAAALLGPIFWPNSAQAVTNMLTEGHTLAQCCQSAVFVLLLIYAQTLLSLPWNMYFTFVVEQRHGFNKQTPRLFLWDALQSVVLTGIFAPPLTMAITYILIWGGTWLPFYLCGFMLCMSLLFMTIYPTLIQPLFNKCEPLPEGSLRSKIEALASSLQFPLKKLFTIDGSKRSAHSNAYM